MLTNAKLPRYFGRRSKVRNEVVVVHGRMVHYTGPFVKGNGPLLIYSWSMIRRRQKYVDQYPDHTVATIHQRLMVALQAAGLGDANSLRHAWDAKYKAVDGKGLNKQTAHNWINGNFKAIEAENLFRLADMTDFSARWILRREGPPGKWLPADPDRLALLEIFDCLSDKQRDAWIAAGKAMVPEERKMGHAVFFEMGEPRK